ncbi:hypothetical protein [Micromonospora zamorensis]|uniref:hypothetical protein n=1 Tax=Micromonospora zamorensis TaxID=709883 RepID=UPI0037926EE2
MSTGTQKWAGANPDRLLPRPVVILYGRSAVGGAVRGRPDGEPGRRLDPARAGPPRGPAPARRTGRTGLMRALARLVAQADGRGGTVLVELHGETPLLLRQTPADGGVATVHLVGGAAGPLAGDDLRLEIEVGPGAAVRVHTHVDYAGRPLLRQSLAVGPRAPGWAGPAVLGGAPATGSLLVVDPSRPADPAAVDGTVARLPLAGARQHCGPPPHRTRTPCAPTSPCDASAPGTPASLDLAASWAFVFAHPGPGRFCGPYPRKAMPTGATAVRAMAHRRP